MNLNAYSWYTGLPTKDENSETTVWNVYCPMKVGERGLKMHEDNGGISRI